MAHPSHDWSGQHRALELWANSIAANTIAALHPDFGPGFNREDYVLVRTDFATFQTTSEGVVAAPVLFYVDIHQTPAAYSVLLQQVNFGKKI